MHFTPPYTIYTLSWMKFRIIYWVLPLFFFFDASYWVLLGFVFYVFIFFLEARGWERERSIFIFHRLIFKKQKEDPPLGLEEQVKHYCSFGIALVHLHVIAMKKRRKLDDCGRDVFFGNASIPILWFLPFMWRNTNLDKTTILISMKHIKMILSVNFTSIE